MKEYKKTIKLRKQSDKPLENWTESNYYRLWYLYDAVVKGINYKHFALEVENVVGPHFNLQRTYEDIQNKDISKEAFIAEMLEQQSSRDSLFNRLKTIRWDAEPEEEMEI